MKFKKLLQGMFFAAAFAATFAITGAVDASAATSLPLKVGTTTYGTVTINMNTQTLNYKPSSGKSSELLVGIGTAAKVKVDKVAKDGVKVAAWDVYDIDGTKDITVDLSKLNNAKDNYIEIKTDNVATPLLIKIPAVAASNVVTFDASTNTINFKAGAKKSETAVASYEYRTAYSSWKDGKEISVGDDDKPTGVVSGVFSEFQNQGATLYLRTPGKAEADITASSELEVYDSANAVAGANLTVNVSDPLPGKEVKLTIAKKANGPKVTLDYVNATVTTPKGTEWRLITETVAKPSSTPTPAPEKGYAKEPVATFLGGEEAVDGSKGTLEVRTSATTNATAPAKSKVASNWTRVAIQTPGTLGDWIKADTKANTTKKDVAVEEGDPTEQWYGNAGVVNSAIYDTDEEGAADKTKTLVSAEYTQSKVNKVMTWNGVKLTNKGADIYQVVVVPSGKTVDEIAATAKNIKTLKAATAKADGTLALTGVTDGSTIYIRKAGNAKTTTWVGKFETFGLVDFYKTSPIE